MENKNENTDIENFKYLIDSRKISDKKQSESITKARLDRYSDRNTNEVKEAKLLQLVFQMEDFLTDPYKEKNYGFLLFLKKYINILYKKRMDFASDISIQPIALSQVINGHREPSNAFLQRLVLHTQQSLEGITNLDGDIWIKILYNDKLKSFKDSRDTWEKRENKFVHISK